MWKRLMWWSLGFLAFIVGGAALATALAPEAMRHLGTGKIRGKIAITI